MIRLSKSFIRFCLVGGIAFIIDAGILTLMTEVFKLSPEISRSLSFPGATLFTWLSNRNYTFQVAKSSSLLIEFLRYLGINIFAFAINWIIYILATRNSAIMHHYPALALIPATACSMMFNYFGMKKYAFKIKD